MTPNNQGGQNWWSGLGEFISGIGKWLEDRFTALGSWFFKLIELLPIGKLTSAQTLNILSEVFGFFALVLIALFVEISGLLVFFSFIVLIGFYIWCNSSTQRRKKN